MLLRGLIGGVFLVGALLAPAVAEDPSPEVSSQIVPTPLFSPPYAVINVALPEFGDRGGGDYGLANVEPLEVGRDVGRGRVIRMVRTPQELRLSRRGEARFQVRLGEVDGIYFWIESPPARGAWHLEFSAVHADGYGGQPIFSQDLLGEALYFANVPAKTLLEFRVTSKGPPHRLSKRFIFTVSPVRLSRWSDERPVPYTLERGVISSP
ncbi:MAG: hypothetical protein L0191_01770 [Acidobacteria bacterium]|nr:hypothetical protein [Acidobacteriota bacterium]